MQDSNPDPPISNSLDALTVVLVSPRNPLNIGAAARAMSNFGCLNLRVVNAYDVAYAEARSAVNASGVLENSEQFQTVADAVADCSLVVGTTAVHNRELLHTVRRLENGGGLIRSAMQHGKVALLFGSEKFGLSIEDMSHCHWLMRIPTRDEHASMNLGQSVAICMYELIRSEAAVTRETKVIRPVDAKQRQRLTEMLIEVLEKTGYLNPRTATSTIQKTRRMINRLDLTTRDSSVWLGILRQILWKLGQE